MFVNNNSDSPVVINYKGRRKTIQPNETVYIDENWVTYKDIVRRYGYFILVPAPSNGLPETMVYDVEETPSTPVAGGSVDLSKYYTRTEIDNKGYINLATLMNNLNAKQDIITGAKGEVLYHNGNSVLPQMLLNEGMVVTTAEEFNSCKSNAPSFADVFRTWKAFSHLNGNQNSSADDLKGWSYNSTKDTIVESVNSVSYTGYVSPKTYSEYDVTVRLYSSDSDDDTIGLVAAFAVDSDGKEHTLSFLTTPYSNGSTARWLCKVDHCTFDPITTTYNQIILANKSSAITTGGSGKNWKSVGSGITVRMQRNGNIFTATCSQFNSTTLDSKTTITINLDELSAQYPILNLFKGASAWGYSSFSQPDSCYQNISVTNADGYIYNLTDNKVYQYASSTGNWTAISGANVVETMGAGRFSFNKETGKLFYCNGTNIIHIGSI